MRGNGKRTKTLAGVMGVIMVAAAIVILAFLAEWTGGDGEKSEPADEAVDTGETTDLQGLTLPLGDEWELSTTSQELQDRPFTTVIDAELCVFPDQTDTCPGFTVIDVVAFEASQGYPYGGIEGEECHGLNPALDGRWYGSTEVVEETTIADVSAVHYTHVPCSDGYPPVLPDSWGASELTHSWWIDERIVVIEHGLDEDVVAGLLAEASFN